MGMVSWLAEIAPWKDADDESYFAIEEIQKFLRGVECMAFGLRQKPDDSCILQQTLDGATWTDVFDFSLCSTIQDQSWQVNITNTVNNYVPTLESIYNNFITNYSGTPASAYPELEAPSGDDSAYAAAYCNAVYTLVSVVAANAVSHYTETVNSAQGEFNFLVGISLFVVAAIGIAGAVPTGGASLTLTAMASQSALVAAGIGLGAGLVNYAVDYLQQHTIDQFQDAAAIEEVACYLVEEVPADSNSKASMLAALDGHGLAGNAGVIADFLAIALQADVTYAAFLEKWNNNLQYAEAGIDLYCPCVTGFKVWVWDFSNGMGDFTFNVAEAGSGCTGTVLGTLVDGRIKGVHCGSQNAISLLMDFDPTWRVRSVKLHTERINGIGNGTFDYTRFQMRPTAGSTVGAFSPISGGFRPNGVEERCNVQNASAPFYWTGANQIEIGVGVTFDADPVSEIYLDKIEIMFEEDFAKGGYTTDDDNLCA